MKILELWTLPNLIDDQATVKHEVSANQKGSSMIFVKGTEFIQMMAISESVHNTLKESMRTEVQMGLSWYKLDENFSFINKKFFYPIP